MQDLAKSSWSLVAGKSKKYLIYFLIIVLAYFAGDKKLIQTALTEIGFENNNPTNYFNLINPKSVPNTFDSKQSENQNKIYFIQKVRVSHVVDGDTFDFQRQDGKKDTVRIMAINTLEMKETDPVKLCFAKLQTQFTKDSLLDKEVYLYGDKTQGERDKYQRILAYVATSSENFVNIDNNYFYNDYLVETGNADTYRANPPAILFNRFEAAKDLAKTNMLGMWSNICK